jgi:deoxyribodipyrimidine photolyase
MKKTLYILVCCLACLNATAQQFKAPIREISFVQDYVTSKDKWEKAKALHGNSYSIALASYKAETHFLVQTTLIIKNGAVVERDFKAFYTDVPDSRKQMYTWVEDPAHLNSHGEGVPPMTMDKLYENCILFHLSQDNTLYDILFQIDENGFIKTCGSEDKKCEDQCFVGYKITSFNWL